jgi:hypothetical protein
MTSTSRLSRQQLAIFAVAIFMAAFATTVAIGITQARSYARPQLVVLGSGERLSVLVADGPARLLLATGTDPAGFGNALAEVRPFGQNRIDILLLAGSANDVTLLDRARRAAGARHVEVLGRTDLPSRVGLPPESLIVRPRRFRLSDRTTVTIEPLDRGNADNGPALAWRAIVQRGETRVVILSDGSVAGEFSRLGAVSALALGGGAVAEALAIVDAKAVIASAEAISGKTLRAAAAAAAHGQLWWLRVHAGDIARFDLLDRGLRLPDNAESIVGTPIAVLEMVSADRRATGGAVTVRLAQLGEAATAPSGPLSACAEASWRGRRNLAL